MAWPLITMGQDACQTASPFGMMGKTIEKAPPGGGTVLFTGPCDQTDCDQLNVNLKFIIVHNQFGFGGYNS
ncbi:MAG: hypothetical protein AAFP92_14380, partial [Bacteroidota bacterium]